MEHSGVTEDMDTMEAFEDTKVKDLLCPCHCPCLHPYPCCVPVVVFKSVHKIHFFVIGRIFRETDEKHHSFFFLI